MLNVFVNNRRKLLSMKFFKKLLVTLLVISICGTSLSVEALDPSIEALRFAIGCDDVDEIKCQLDGGMDVNVVLSEDNPNTTPLTYAVSFEHTAAAKFLLDNGAEITKQVLFNAALIGNRDIIELLLNKDKSTSYKLLEHAVSMNVKHSIEYLLDKGAKIDDHILSIAVIKKHEHEDGKNERDIVALLLDRGAEISAGVFRQALCSGSREVVELLLDRGTEVSDSDLEIAAECSNKSVVELLLDKGARISDTTLMAAVNGGNNDIIKLLLNKGAKINEDVLCLALSLKFK